MHGQRLKALRRQRSDRHDHLTTFPGIWPQTSSKWQACAQQMRRTHFHSRLLRQWPDQHDHLTTFHLGEVLDPACFFRILSDALQQLPPQLLVRHFAATEA